MKADTRDTILRALLADNEERHELYHHSPVFRAGARLAVELLDSTLDGIASRAHDADEQIDAATRAVAAATPTAIVSDDHPGD